MPFRTALVTCESCKGTGYILDKILVASHVVASLGLSLLFEGGRDGFSSELCRVCDGHGSYLKTINLSRLRRY